MKKKSHLTLLQGGKSETKLRPIPSPPIPAYQCKFENVWDGFNYRRCNRTLDHEGYCWQHEEEEEEAE